VNTHRTVVAASIALALCCATADASPEPGIAANRIAVDPVTSRAYVAQHEAGLLSIVDLETRTQLVAVPAGAHPRRVLHDAARARAYVVDDASPGVLHVIDTRTGAIATSVALGDGADAIAADLPRGEVYVASRDSGTVAVIDTATDAVVATLALGGTPAGLAVSARRGKLYVADTAGARVVVVDQASRAVVATIAVGRAPQGVAVDDAVGRAYANAATDAVVDVIDTAVDRVVAVLPAGRGSTTGVVSPAYGRYYLANRDDGTVTVIDTRRDVVLDTVVTGGAPGEVVVDADRGVLYVAHAAGEATAVIDAASLRIVRLLPGSAAALALAVDPARGALLTLDRADALEALRIEPMASPLQDTALAVEYRDANSGQYFHTASDDERALVDDGALGRDWSRTQAYWRVWTAPAAGRVPMCRLYGTHFGATGAHLYTPYGHECGATAKSAGGGWAFEGIAYFVAMPNRDGTCAPHTVPVYRLYDGSRAGAPNHRYTTDAAVRDAMVAQGWIAEGSGADAVFACTPPVADTAPAAAELRSGLNQRPLAVPPGVMDQRPGSVDGARPPVRVRIPLVPRMP
jgi:YVTN family beta-propeller protein